MKSSEKNEIVESLFQAIETIAKKQMSRLAYDKTILCKVTDDTYRSKGEYTVSDGTSSFIKPSTVFFKVIAESGHPLQAPSNFTVTILFL